jgi:hypothetical protein
VASPAELRQIEPGETVFVLSEEYLRLPRDIKAELSHKRKLSHEGVLILGGFCIDPLYKGYLVFGIHNISAEPFPLEKGRKLIAAQFYRLAPEEQTTSHAPESLEEFPRDITRTITRFGGVSNVALQKRIDELDVLLRALRTDFDEREKWFTQIGTMVTDLGASISALKTSLEVEREQREKGEDDLGQLVKEQHRVTQRHETSIKLLFYVGLGLLSLLGTVVGYFVIEGIKSELSNPPSVTVPLQKPAPPADAQVPPSTIP